MMNTTNDNRTEGQDDQWEACRPGEIGGVVQRLQSRRRARTVQQGAGIAAILFVAVVSGFYSLGLLSGTDAVGSEITHAEVLRNAESYLAGLLNAETEEKIRRHLAHCRHCREEIEEMKRKPAKGVHNAEPQTTGQLSWHPVPRTRLLSSIKL